MTPYRAIVQEAGQETTAKLSVQRGGWTKVLEARATTKEDALRLLAQKLRTSLNQGIVEGQPMEPGPVPAGEGVQVEVEPASTQHDAEASKDLLSFTKHLAEQAEANLLLADSRARQNGLLALAIIPVLTFLRSSATDTWASWLTVAVLVGIFGTLILTVLATRTEQVLSAVDLDQIDTDRLQVFRGHRDAQGLRFVLQGAWLASARACRRLATRRFRYVRFQLWTLGLALSGLAALMVRPLF
ncbi:hypothetical protein [Deinococcus sp. SL84]|uniref:hypothetical protein n=1 Tax=Deinococcus sp. SL84 TaxID=2994663 RepID=UPI002274C901|nr:hypothetical protein [Deinococcus sp. SL84]MCY1703568.1 hypothetical protein [Deinococcus sp. SL84]